MIENLSQDILSRHPKNGEFLVVAMDGRGGAGKTTLSNLLSERLPGFEVIHGDDFWEPSSDSEFGWFNEERFQSDVLTPIAKGTRDITYRPYDWSIGQLGAEKSLHFGAGVLIERCYAIKLPLAWDFTIWVDVSPEVSLQRGIARNPNQSNVWSTLWRPREDDYIETYRPRETADAIVDGSNYLGLGA